MIFTLKVIAVGLLITLAISGGKLLYANLQDKQRMDDLRQVKQALLAFYQDNGYYPTELSIRCPPLVSGMISSP